MAKIHAMMDIGKRSMMNSQTALQTVSHNIANKSTEGYSRQRVEQVTAEPIGEGRLRMGMGSKASQVTRTNNSFLEKQIAHESGKMGFGNGQAENLGRVEQIFNEQINKGLNQFMGTFFNSFRELANNPESLATRSIVKESAEFMTRDFKRINTQLKDIQADIDNQVSSQVQEINSMTKEIAKLNESIEKVEIQGMPANDERDRRDLLIKKLGEKVNIKCSEGDNGKVGITIGNTAMVVSGYESVDLKVDRTPEHGKKREGQLDIIFQQTNHSTPFAVTDQIKSGQLGGALHIRDNVINDLLAQIDEMAFSVAKSVNEVHTLGYNGYGEHGLEFFDLPVSLRDASENLNVNSAISKDVLKISSAAEPNSPADNRVANVLSSLQYQKLMDNGTSTAGDYYNGIVGKLAVVTNKANMEAEHQKSIVAQLNNVRESISGVSLDEEAIKMIEYQKSFDASARLIRTADEMFDTVLNLKR